MIRARALQAGLRRSKAAFFLLLGDRTELQEQRSTGGKGYTDFPTVEKGPHSSDFSPMTRQTKGPRNQIGSLQIGTN